MINQLTEAIEDFSNDPQMRVGIVTGSGRAFCAGGDLREMAEGTFKGQFGATYPYSGNSKPFIAAINGLAVGGGMETALDCDIRICSSAAYFGLFEPKRGIMAGYATKHLARVIGLSAANYILLTADRIEPQQALEWGIVTEVLEPDRLIPRAIEIAEMIIENAPLSSRARRRRSRSGGWRRSTRRSASAPGSARSSTPRKTRRRARRPRS